MVRSLSGGFDDDAWVSRIAKPLIEELGRELRMAGIHCDALGYDWSCASTDHRSPLATDRYSPGHRLPLLPSAGGRMFLSFSSPRAA